MRRFAMTIAICAVVFPGIAAAEEFQRLNGDEILEALTGRKLSYGDGVWQTFEPSMHTNYFSGGPSQGIWAVRDD